MTVDKEIDGVDAVAIGGFESLHVGHRKLLNHLSEFDKSAVVTFDPLPKEALGYTSSRILLEDERICAISSMGIQMIAKIPFDKIKDLEPFIFLDNYLSSVGTIVVGENFHFGKDAKGDIALLYEWCVANGKGLIVEPLSTLNGETISTKLIKSYIHQGNVEKAMELLGYPYFLKGQRVGGNKIGHKLGIPTINLHWNQHKTRPPYGVYDGLLITENWHGPALASFGKAPTFDRKDVLLEIYVPDEHIVVGEGQQVLYGFHHFIREEARFDTPQALVEQIHADEQELAKDSPLITEKIDQLYKVFKSDCLLSFK